MRATYYRQCTLERRQLESVVRMVSFIPEKFANLGKILRLRDNDGAWIDGWLVAAVGSERVAEAMLPDAHRGIKQHRQATGDALPKG